MAIVVAASLVFAAPAWAPLPWAAGAALAWEALSLLAWARRRLGASGGLAAAACALLAGPLTAMIAALHLAMAGGERKSSRAWLWAGLRGSLLAAGAALLVWGSSANAIGVLSACGGAWMVRGYRRTTSPLKRREKFLLLALRLAVVALLAMWALRPTLEHHFQRPIRRTVLIGIDASSSMQRRDVRTRGGGDSKPPPPLRRIDAVRDALAGARRGLASLAEQADVEFFAMSSSAQPLPDAAPDRIAQLQADGPATALGDSVAAAFDSMAARKRDVAAVVLISDGCNNTADVMAPDKLAAWLGGRGVPVHTVGVGSDSASASVRAMVVRGLAAPDEVERFNRLPISATVEAVGMADRQVKITCKFGQDAVSEEVLRLSGSPAVHPVRFSHVPLASGFQRLTVTAEPVKPEPDEEIAGQPSASRLVHVVDRQIRVLYVEGRFRYESKYVAQALAADKRFGLDRRVLLMPAGAEAGPALGDKLEDWLPYHVILLGDVPASQFTAGQLEILRKMVGEYGKGLCMIGGMDSFGPAWGATPLAGVLPVDLGQSKGQLAGPLQATPTAEGRSSDILRIGQDGQDVQAAWASLPPLDGANRLAGVKLGATVLAAAPGGEPLIVAQPYGKGRTMAVAFDSTWRWVLSPKDTGELQRRFWRQAALYLADPKGHVWIATDKTRYDLRRLREGPDAVDVTAGVEDARGVPSPSAEVAVVLKPPSGPPRKLAMAADGATRRTRLAGLTEPGLYKLQITARLEGKELSAEQEFEVVSLDLEAQEVLADLDLLRQMARASGGRYVGLEGLDDLLQRLAVGARPAWGDELLSVDLSAAARWPAVLALIALLCLEWALRKRKGLV